MIVEKTKVLTVTATKYRNRTIVETRPDGTVIKTEERAGSSTVAVDQSLEQVSKKESTQIKKTVEARKQHAYMLDTAVTFPLDSPSDRRYLIGIGARVGNTPLFVTSSVTFNPSNLGSIPMVGVGFRLEL